MHTFVSNANFDRCHACSRTSAFLRIDEVFLHEVLIIGNDTQLMPQGTEAFAIDSNLDTVGAAV